MTKTKDLYCEKCGKVTQHLFRKNNKTLTAMCQKCTYQLLKEKLFGDKK
jgi:uncharacterized Zn finger protein